MKSFKDSKNIRAKLAWKNLFNLRVEKTQKLAIEENKLIPSIDRGSEKFEVEKVKSLLLLIIMVN